ncbi:MAG: hypothetical protein J5I90_09170 [Caldilineales bacterium]|nr:hypothetical protein [Caldilineales bacterium]
MASNRRFLLASVVLVLALLLAACGATDPGASAPDTSSFVAFPRVVIEVDEQGNASFAGMTTQTLKNLTLGMLDLTPYRMDPAWIQYFMATDLQNIELAYRDDGIYTFVNGKALPFLVWSEDALDNTVGFLTDIGGMDPQFANALSTILPLVQSIGLDVAVQFPVMGGREAAPLRDLSVPLMIADKAGGEAGSGAQIALQIDVVYDEEGVPQVPGAAFILQNLLGVDLNQLRLPPATIAALQASGIERVTVQTGESGLYIQVNDMALPAIAWSEGQLQTTIELISTFFLGDQAGSMMPMLETVLPVLADLNATLVLHFPSA